MVWRVRGLRSLDGGKRVSFVRGIIHFTNNTLESTYCIYHDFTFSSTNHIINNNASRHALHHHVPSMGAGSTRSHFSHHDFSATGCSVSINETTAIVVSSLDRCQPNVNSEYLKQKAPYRRIMRKS